MSSWAAWTYTVVTVVACLFQAALAAGAPWGALAMGGRHPGRFPPALRVGAVVQLVLLLGLALVVLVRAGIVLPDQLPASRIAIWIVVAISASSSVLNLLTPSRWERILWAPVALTMLACSCVVAVG